MNTLVMKLKFPAKATIAAGGTPQRLSASHLYVSSFAVLWDPANSGTVYVGESDVTANKCFPISATTPSFSASADDKLGAFPRKVYDLYDIFIDGTTADIVRVVYSIVSDGVNTP